MPADKSASFVAHFSIQRVSCLGKREIRLVCATRKGFDAHVNFYKALWDASIVYRKLQFRFVLKVLNVSTTVGVAQRNRSGRLPNILTLIHLHSPDIFCSYWARKWANTDKWWLLFFSWTMRTGFVRTICHCIDITAAPAPKNPSETPEEQENRQRSFRATTRLSLSSDSRRDSLVWMRALT